MDFPKTFVIANFDWKVKLVDHLESNNYGEFDDIKCEIRIATHIKDNKDNLIKLSEEQIRNTYVHELIHCFNWLYNNETSEGLAQTFANFIREYCSTSGISFSYN